MKKKIIKLRRFFKLKRLKIAEQILIVLLIAVITPMIISGIVINNINQQAMRAQLRISAELIANTVSEEVDVFTISTQDNLQQISSSLNYFPTKEGKNMYLRQISKDLPQYDKLELVNTQKELDEISRKNSLNNRFTRSTKTKEGKFLVATFLNKEFGNHLFKSLKDDIRQIYIIDKDGKLIASHNYEKSAFIKTLSLLPKKTEKNVAEIFGDIKNQPLAYYSKTEPEIKILVNTTAQVTQKTINDNRFKLLLAVFIASLSVFIVVALYIYYLYINIRQLFKGIMAISKGSYERRIRLIKNIFTPYEIVFLAYEFNKMVDEINKSYSKLKENNEELIQLNEFRSNLIDTVSHELRTPLTSIQGYTSRLLRQDIQIDEDTKQKSLRTIKRQSERLKRMIEDLLVIPDIERSRIRIDFEPVWLNETIETAILLIKNENNKEIITKIDKNFPLIIADKDRMEQVIVNLLENAVKYAKENEPIILECTYDEHFATIFIKNNCEVISSKKLATLFEKFTRIDDKTTRTTRGTGLGLFIVKGLVEAMNGNIEISSDETCGFCVKLIFPIFKEF